MTASEEGIDFIIAHEGCKLAAYPDPATGGEPWTIGVGHTGGVRAGDTCTEDEAREFLRADLRAAEACVNESVKGAITQGQFDALISLVFNIGGGNFRKSTLLKELNAGNDMSAAQQFLVWNRAAGKVMAGLTKRRADEMQVFLA